MFITHNIDSKDDVIIHDPQFELKLKLKDRDIEMLYHRKNLKIYPQHYGTEQKMVDVLCPLDEEEHIQKNGFIQIWIPKTIEFSDKMYDLVPI